MQVGTGEAPAHGELAHAEVAELIQLLLKAIRAHQIYDVANPVYQRFVSTLRETFGRVWPRTSSLHFEIADEQLLWEEKAIEAGEGKDNLAYLFHKDGVRSITFLEGFEEDVPTFLEVIHRARHSPRESDDLISLLWESDFKTFQYEYVDQLAQGLEIPEGGEGLTFELPTETFQQEVAAAESAGAEEDTSSSRASASAAPPPPEMLGIVRPEDFQETLFFLDDVELRALKHEVELEMRRDVKTDVVRALFDRIEDGQAARQSEILDILQQLLPSLLIRGDMAGASRVLVELNALLERGDALKGGLRERAQGLYEELSRSESVTQLVRALQDGVIEPGAEELGIFFMHLRPTALPVLLSAARRAEQGSVRERLETGVDAIGDRNRDAVLELLEDESPEVAAGAADVVARLKLEAAAPLLARLLFRTEPDVRAAAVEAALALHTGATMNVAMTALEDEDREVRMAAARGLAEYRFQPARPRLENALKGAVMKDADRTERILFYEAYATIGGPDAVEFLDGVLNGRSRLGMRQATELRACAARALGLINAPAAKESLRKAVGDKDVVVRNEVSRAMRQEMPAR